MAAPAAIEVVAAAMAIEKRQLRNSRERSEDRVSEEEK